MSWFFEHHTIPSALNGEIVCTRSFGDWRTSVKGTTQSGWFIRKLWTNALRKLDPLFRPNRILMLGLGTGSAVSVIRNKYPRASLDVIEMDDVMVQLIKRFHLVTEKHMPNLLIGDAYTRLSHMTDVYDLIIMDLFDGSDVPADVSTAAFFTSVAQHLSPSGIFLANLYADATAMSAMRQVFSISKEWIELTNRVMLAQRPPSPDYIPYRTNPAYLQREFGKNPAFSVMTDAKGIPGLAWKIGPLKFLRRTSEEPPLPDEQTKRILLWQPMRQIETPAGWMKSPFAFTTQQTGYIDVTQDGYWQGWGSHAKRHRTLWLRQTDVMITECIGQDVMQTEFPKRFQDRVRESVPRHGERVRVFLAHPQNNPKKIVAALAVVDVPEIFGSIHLASFILPEVRKSSVGVGMMCAWFERCRKEQIRFADLDIIWAPGDPQEWKGYSTFKMHFKPQIIRYPQPLLRLG